MCQVVGGSPPADAADAPGPDAPDASQVADGDSDGIADAQDNCPANGNANQADEDRDLAGDACDVCVQVAGAPAGDRDADLVGDACDPNPDTRDEVWLFEGFLSGMRPQWFGTQNWTAVVDALQVSAAGGQDDDDEFLILPLIGRSFDQFSLSATLQVSQVIGSQVHEIGVSVFDDDQGLFCILVQGSSSSQRVLMFEAVFDNQNPQQKSAAFPWVFGNDYRVTLVRRGSNYTCSVVGPEGMQTLTATSSLVPTNDAELSAFGMAGQFTSVLVVGPP